MWELQTHMHAYVAPSIWKTADAQGNSTQWLAERYADQRWSEDDGTATYNTWVETALKLSHDVLVEAVAEKAIEYDSTTNGGWEVYLDGWTSVPWCTDDELQAWYA